MGVRDRVTGKLLMTEEEKEAASESLYCGQVVLWHD